MCDRPGTSAKLRLLVQHGLGTLRAAEKHGLQPALLIHWAQHLTDVVRLLTVLSQELWAALVFIMLHFCHILNV